MKISPISISMKKIPEQKKKEHENALAARIALSELSVNRGNKLKTTLESNKFISSFRKTSPEERKQICLETFDGDTFAHDLLPKKEQRYEVISSLKGDDEAVRTLAHQLLGSRNFRPLKPEETEFLISEQKDDENLIRDIINYEPVNIGYCSPEVQQTALKAAGDDTGLNEKIEKSIQNAKNGRISFLA